MTTTATTTTTTTTTTTPNTGVDQKIDPFLAFIHVVECLITLMDSAKAIHWNYAPGGAPGVKIKEQSDLLRSLFTTVAVGEYGWPYMIQAVTLSLTMQDEVKLIIKYATGNHILKYPTLDMTLVKGSDIQFKFESLVYGRNVNLPNDFESDGRKFNLYIHNVIAPSTMLFTASEYQQMYEPTDRKTLYSANAAAITIPQNTLFRPLYNVLLDEKLKVPIIHACMRDGGRNVKYATPILELNTLTSQPNNMNRLPHLVRSHLLNYVGDESVGSNTTRTSPSDTTATTTATTAATTTTTTATTDTGRNVNTKAKYSLLSHFDKLQPLSF
jgi:hypothetical protein